jgi:hypothetical protein
MVFSPQCVRLAINKRARSFKAHAEAAPFHFAILLFDDKEALRKALADAGIEVPPGPFLDFLDP